jgi:hypothetical protein
MPRGTMTRILRKESSPAHMLAKRILATLGGGHFATNFVDEYAQQFHRPEASAHPARRDELEAILEREMLLAISARVARTLEEKTPRRRSTGRGKHAGITDPARFLRDLVAALARESKWTAGDTMEFRGDLEIYIRLAAMENARSSSRSARAASGRAFVDRCAILLDPSMIENATRAAGKLLPRLESLVDKLLDEVSTRRQ